MDPIPRSNTRRLPVRLAAYIILGAILLTLGICALAAIAIRSIDSVLLYAEQPEFAEIFTQLETAELDPHFLIPFVLFLLWLCVTVSLSRKIRAWTILPAGLMGLILTAVSLAAAVWFADVNGIRFGTVVLSLMKLLETGIL